MRWLPFAILLLVSGAAHAQGYTRLAFDAPVLDAIGLAVAGGRDFASTSDLVRIGSGDDFEGFAAGALRHRGAVSLRVGGRSWSLAGFELRPGNDPMVLELFDATDARWLVLENPQPVWREGVLFLENVDVTLAPELADRLGRPLLAGSFVGEAHLQLPPESGSQHAAASGSAPAGPCDEVYTEDRDVSLIDVGQVTQVAREPGGRVAITFAAALRNEGTSTIEWKRAIEPDGSAANVGEHPFLALHFYRIADGRIRQIGRSGVKHAFFSANTGCSCAGAQFIYAGCEDLYSAATNRNQQFLAPRDEVTASTGGWTRVGSHFDGTPVDDFRHHHGDVDHDDFEHRLVVDEAELLAGGTYYADAWYLIRDDVDLLNSMGREQVLPIFGGSTWAFQTATSLVSGSILDAWVDPNAPPAGAANLLRDTGEGRLQLAVVTSDLGGGSFHYEYALLNFDFDRQVRSFHVPFPPGAIVSNPSFIDADALAGNDWTVTVGAEAVTWDAPAGNEMDWGTLYSFGFDADVAPANTTLLLGALESSGPAAIEFQTLGPMPPAMPVPLSPGARFALGALLLLVALRARYSALATSTENRASSSGPLRSVVSTVNTVDV